MSFPFNTIFKDMLKTVSSNYLYKKIITAAEKKYLIKNLSL
jgi:hypothetical protein